MRKLLTPNQAYTINYPEAIELAEKQTSIFWTAEEVHVEKDVHSILTELTEAERHGVITTLKLFTQYELIVGNEYWKQVGDMFRHPADIQRMAATFSFFELGVHGPFYSKINEALGLANEEFYTEYLRDPVLADRINMLEGYADPDKPLEFLLALAFAEGVVLYSSFAFLKHFQSQGKNKILNIVRGINFSVRDESLHCDASCWLYRTLLDELGIDPAVMLETAHKMAEVVREHEHAIVDKIFEKGGIEGITAVQLKHFVDSRINLVLRQLGYNNLYDVKYNPILEWFDAGINAFSFNDFFSGQGREYSRDWSENDLSW